MAELEQAFAAAAAAADAPPAPKGTTDGWAAALAALAPSVAKMKATALETDPEKQLYAPAMRDKVLALATRLEAAQAALSPLQVRGCAFAQLRRGEITLHEGASVALTPLLCTRRSALMRRLRLPLLLRQRRRAWLLRLQSASGALRWSETRGVAST